MDPRSIDPKKKKKLESPHLFSIFKTSDKDEVLTQIRIVPLKS